MLDTELWPVIARHFPTDDYLFQEDSAPVHTSERPSAGKQRNNIKCITMALTITRHQRYRKCVAYDKKLLVKRRT